MTDVAIDLETAIDTHLAAYCEPDPERRDQLVREAWAHNGTLVDPPFDGAGHDGIAAMSAALQDHYAKHRFRRTTGVDAHHDVARYGWELVDPAGTVVLAGIDIATVDADGKLANVTGFFGELPSLDR